MSRKHLETGKRYIMVLLTPTLIFPFLGFMGFLAIYYWEETIQREPAEFHHDKKEGTIEINKMRMPLSITLRSSSIPKNDNQEIVQVEATIKANQEINESIHYQWIMPSGIEVLNLNLLNGEIEKLNLGETISLPIEITGFTVEKSLSISFQAFYLSDNQQKIGNSALISSNESKNLESVALHKMRLQLNREKQLDSLKEKQSN